MGPCVQIGQESHYCQLLGYQEAADLSNVAGLHTHGNERLTDSWFNVWTGSGVYQPILVNVTRKLKHELVRQTVLQPTVQNYGLSVAEVN